MRPNQIPIFLRPSGGAVSFSFAAPGILSVARTGTQWVQTSATTAASVAANVAAIETRDGFTGTWSHPSYINLVDADMLGWTTSGTQTYTQNFSTGPDGTSTASRFLDTDAAANAYRVTFGTNLDCYLSAWIRDDAVSPPTAPGTLGGTSNLVAGAVSLGSGNNWRRLELSLPINQDAGPGANDIIVLPAGYQPGPVPTVGATGGVNVWKAMRVESNRAKVPIASGTVSTAVLSIPAANLASVLMGGGIDVEWVGIPAWADQNSAPAVCGWSMTSPDGLHKISATAGGAWTWTVKGATVLTAAAPVAGTQTTAQAMVEGQLFKVRAWYDPAGLSAGLRFTAGGATSADATATAVAGALSPASGMWLGSNSGTSEHTPIRHYAMTVRPGGSSRARTTEGLVLGDSTISSYIGFSSVASLIYTTAEQTTRAGVFDIAYPGSTIAQQQTAVGTYGIPSSTLWVMIEIGLNDVGFTETDAAVIGRLQSLVTAVNAAKPAGCKVLIGTLTPCRQRLIDIYGGVNGPTAYTQWLNINTAITGGGGTPITGVDSRVSSHTTSLNDGSGNLAAAYDSGDHIHEIQSGRAIVAAAWRTAISALGLI